MQRLLLIFFTCIFSLNIYSWEATGHMLVAHIAYKRLDKKVIEQVDQILQNAHDGSPETSSFEAASVWPDIIKKRGNKLFNSWHYQDEYYSIDDSPLPKSRSDGQALEVLKRLKKILSAETITTNEKAFALKMFIHIFGDMHQPLHNATRVSKDFKHGNMRGKLFPLEGSYSDLHSFWDNGFGLLNNDLKLPLVNNDYLWLDSYTNFILEKVPAATLDKKAITTKSKKWHDDHIKIVRKKLYKDINPGEAPSTEYIDTNREILHQQLALGGFRLANALNCIFGSDICLS